MKDEKIPKKIILNMGGSSECSRYDIGAEVAKHMTISNDRYIGIDQEPICGGIERPLCLQMKNDLLQTTLGIKMSTLEESMNIIFS